MNNWHIIFVLGNYAQRLCGQLKKNGFEAFIPTKEKMYRENRRYYKVEQVLFPGYIFVESSLSQAEFTQKINELKYEKNGIIKELRHDFNGTSALTNEERLMIERLLGKNKCIEHSIGFIENDVVTISEGPLVGLESQIIKINRHKKTATLQMMLFNEVKEIQVSLEIISKI